MDITNALPTTIKKSILIPDGESHLLIYVINCLGQVPGIKIHVMSSIKWNPLRFSKYVSKFKYYPKVANDEKWLHQINTEIEKNKIDIVMPIFEIGIRRIIKNKASLAQSALLVPLPDLETFTTVINKWKLACYCENNKIPVPKSFLYTPGEVISASTFEGIKFPVIIKPLEGFGGGIGIEIFKNIEDLLKHLREKADQLIIVQNFIKGYDIDCSILAKDGKILAHTIQQGYIAGASPFMPQIGLEFVNNPVLFGVVEKLITSLKWDGVAHLDLRYDEEVNEYKIIELNPRFWGSLDASYLMGINFPYLLTLVTLGYNINPITYKYEKYLSLKGLSRTLKKDFYFIINRKFLLRNTQFRFVLFDPIPTAFKYMNRTKNIFLKKIRRQ
jgi:D-aspartate ligase